MSMKPLAIRNYLAVWMMVCLAAVSVTFAADSPDAAVPAGVNQKGRTVVLDDIVFGFDEASLKPESGEILEWLVLYLVKNPEKKVVISGHTDVTGPDAYNTYLSKKRAHAVSQVLTKAGITRDRILLRWFGEKQPIGDNARMSSRVKSRRVEIEIQ